MIYPEILIAAMADAANTEVSIKEETPANKKGEAVTAFPFTLTSCPML